MKNKNYRCSPLPPEGEGTRRAGEGFTLLELMIVVIIIAVLSAVAWPMYKHAVLKSRFSTVMPAAKAVADAQEVYYLGNNQYALGKEELDVAPVQAENTQVDLSTADEEDKYIYVAAKRSDIPDVRYIMYQKNSPKFAGNIHCEAKADNEEALWLCEKGLHGTELTGEGNSSIQGNDYKTFLLAGTRGTGDYFAKACSGSAEKTCSCGGPVTGSCNEETGNWVYETDCPTPDPDASEECPSGYVGSRTRHAECENGVYVNKWTEDCELACPTGAVCDENGTITGCENNYYKKQDGSCAVVGNYDYAGDSSCTTNCNEKSFGDEASCAGSCWGTSFSGEATCTSTANCSSSTAQGTSTFTDHASCEGKCYGASFSGEASCSGTAACSNFGGRSVTLTDYASCTDEAYCYAAAFSGNAICTGNATCSGATFSGNSICTSTNKCSTSGGSSKFSANSVCAGRGCETANYEGNACCAGNSSSCPAGVKRCVYDASTKTYIRSGTW